MIGGSFYLFGKTCQTPTASIKYSCTKMGLNAISIHAAVYRRLYFSICSFLHHQYEELVDLFLMHLMNRWTLL